MQYLWPKIGGAGREGEINGDDRTEKDIELETELETAGRWAWVGREEQEEEVKKFWSEKQLKYNMKISNSSP